MLKPLAPFQQVESARDSTRDTATISPVSVTVQPADSAPQPEVKTPSFSLSKVARQEACQLSRIAEANDLG